MEFYFSTSIYLPTATPGIQIQCQQFGSAVRPRESENGRKEGRTWISTGNALDASARIKPGLRNRFITAWIFLPFLQAVSSRAPPRARLRLRRRRPLRGRLRPPDRVPRRPRLHRLLGRHAGFGGARDRRRRRQLRRAHIHAVGALLRRAGTQVRGTNFCLALLANCRTVNPFLTASKTTVYK